MSTAPMLERVFFNYVWKNKKYIKDIHPSFFKDALATRTFKVLQDYLSADSTIETPTPHQLYQMVNLDTTLDKVEAEVFKSFVTIDMSKYDDVNFIVPHLKEWILRGKYDYGVNEFVSKMRESKTNTTDSKKSLPEEEFRQIFEEMTTFHDMEDEDLGSDFMDANAHHQNLAKYKIPTGMQTLDKILGGGWDRCTLNVLMAETNSGKCVTGDMTIKIRDKVTGQEFEVTMLEFYNLHRTLNQKQTA
jgi:hypothetical protein